MIYIIKMVLCCLALCSLCSCYVEGKLSVMQGAATDTQTQFHIISAENETLAFFYESDDKKLYQIPEENIKASFNVLKKYSIFKVNVSGLAPKKEYTLNIISKEKRKLIGRRKFYTRKRDRFKRIAVLSCSGDFVAQEKRIGMWKQLESLRPDAVFMIGDNVYADITPLKLPVSEDVDQILQRYMDHRFSLSYYSNNLLTPTYATWDDHDFGKNDVGREFKLKGKMQEVFHMMYAQDLPEAVKGGPGVSRVVNMGDYQMILLDNRSYRDPEDKKKAQLLGDGQRYWLQDILKNSLPGFIVSGDQFFGDYHRFGSYQRYYPYELKKVLRSVNKAPSVFGFISGDRHMSEVQEVPLDFLKYQTYEFTSSPMHSTLYPDRSADKPNPRRKWAVSDKFNFMILEVFEAKPKEMKLGVSFWGSEGILWKTPIKISK